MADKVIIDKTKLTAMGDAIRSKTGSSASFTVDEMTEQIANISTGIDTSDATATSSDILAGKTAYANNKKIEGAIKKYDYSVGEGGVLNEGGIEIVDELPTNPRENVIYQVNEVCDIGILVFDVVGNLNYLEVIINSQLGVKPNLIYYLVDSLPETPNVSDLQTFNTLHIYINSETLAVYGNAGQGEMWIPVAYLYNSMSGQEALYYRGYVENAGYIYEAGIYVTYKLGKQGVVKKKGQSLLANEGGWTDYEQIFFRTVKEYSNHNIITIPEDAFKYCLALEKVDIPNARLIKNSAFYECYSLPTIHLPKVEYIENLAFFGCRNLKDIYLGNSQFVWLEEREAVDILNVEGCNVHVRAELVSSYETATNWSALIAEGKIRIIGDCTDE